MINLLIINLLIMRNYYFDWYFKFNFVSHRKQEHVV